MRAKKRDDELTVRLRSRLAALEAVHESTLRVVDELRSKLEAERSRTRCGDDCPRRCWVSPQVDAANRARWEQMVTTPRAAIGGGQGDD